MTLRKKVITIIIIVALSTYALVSTFVIWRMTTPFYDSQSELRQEITELYQRISDLEFMLENIDDPDVIRRIAEETLGLVSPEEVILFDESD